MTLIIDAHEDLAWNMINLQRDYTQSAYAIRASEAQTGIPAFNGNTLLGWPEYQVAEVGIVFATLYCSPKRLDQEKYPVRSYENPEEARECYRENLDAYWRLTEDHHDKFRLIFSQSDLVEHLSAWDGHLAQTTSSPPPVGLIILMEGAEGIREPAEVEQWFEWGVRLIGPAWAGNHYCGGTREPGPLTDAGVELLENMAGLNMVLDISHMDHQSARQALDVYEGAIIASHSNAETLIPGIPINRHLKTDTIQHLIERDGVMGIVPLNGFLNWDWRSEGGRESLSLDKVIAQIDFVCQMAGNTKHVGIGSDFDGGFGCESVPPEIDTVADLRKLAPKLAEKGYNEDDIQNIFCSNWLRILKQSLPS